MNNIYLLFIGLGLLLIILHNILKQNINAFKYSFYANDTSQYQS